MAGNVVGGHRFIWKTTDTEEEFRRPLYRELIASAAFQRLGDIRFLGAIDYFVRPSGRRLDRRRHTRLEHTLGVALLALRYAQIRNLSEQEEMLVVAAALLHDIGHAPLSHSMEPAFKEQFGLSHHRAGKEIILGHAPRGVGREIKPALERAGIDIEQVLALISGKLEGSAHNFLFAHPINIDTIEAISRSETYIQSDPTSPPPDAVLDALLDPSHHARVLDGFWALKDRVYSVIINGPLGILADHISLAYMREHADEFKTDDFFLTERTLRRKHPGLFHALRNTRTQLLKALNGAATSEEAPWVISFAKRHFYIDSEALPGSPERYRQSKTPATIAFAQLQSQARHLLTQTRLQLPLGG